MSIGVSNMNVTRIAPLKAAALWSTARPSIARSHAFQTLKLISAARNGASQPRAGIFGLEAPLGTRFISGDVSSREALQKGVVEDFSNFDFDYDLWSFGTPELQKVADEAREAGWVVLRSRFARGGGQFLKFVPFYLRENCQCSTCVHPDTKQRAIDPFSIPEDINAVKAEIREDRTGAKITWSDGHEGFYPWRWLTGHQQNQILLPKYPPVGGRAGRPRPHTFYDPVKGDSYPEVLYEDVMAKDEAMLQWLENIWNLGFCFVKGVPVDPESTKALIERIAFVRHTHYGGFWDFTADLTFKDTAYTNEFLGAHTDNTYFTDPARLQLFHLLSHTDGSGGASLLVDGFSAARQLLDEDRKLYQTLATHRHAWHTSGNEDVCIQPSTFAPVFSEHPDMDRVYQIRWNNYDRGARSDWSLEDHQLWYKAARRYDAILKDMKRQIWTQLEPGTALIFDNWRMMHGRSEFTGKRRMCGGYVNNDDFVSRYRLLKYGRETVLNNIGNLWNARMKRPPSPYLIY